MVELARVNAAVRASGDVIYEWDLADDQLSWIGHAASLFGHDGGDAHPQTGEKLQQLIHPEDLLRRTQAISAHFTGARNYECEYRIRGKDGQFQWVHDRGAAVKVTGGTPSRLVGIMRTVTRRKQREARLEYLANYDDLTGHFNKLRLREALDQALVHGLRFGQIIALRMARSCIFETPHLWVRPNSSTSIILIVKPTIGRPERQTGHARRSTPSSRLCVESNDDY